MRPPMGDGDGRCCLHFGPVLADPTPLPTGSMARFYVCAGWRGAGQEDAARRERSLADGDPLPHCELNRQPAASAATTPAVALGRHETQHCIQHDSRRGAAPRPACCVYRDMVSSEFVRGEVSALPVRVRLCV